MIDGLANGTRYDLKVYALTGAGESLASNALPGVPRAEGQEAAGPQKRNLPRHAGGARALVDGRPTPADTSVNRRDGSTTFHGEGWSLGLRPENGEGNPQIVIDRSLQPERGQFVRVTADGFLPDSTAKVFLFTKTYRLGDVAVRSDGTFDSRLRVPQGVPAGEHTIQVNGYSYDGRSRTANLGVVINDGAASLTKVKRSTKAQLQVYPQCSVAYPFTLQRKTGSGSWHSARTGKTRGNDQTRIMDLTPGIYRARVGSKCDNPAYTTGAIRIGPKQNGKG